MRHLPGLMKEEKVMVKRLQPPPVHKMMELASCEGNCMIYLVMSYYGSDNEIVPVRNIEFIDQLCIYMILLIRLLWLKQFFGIMKLFW